MKLSNVLLSFMLSLATAITVCGAVRSEVDSLIDAASRASKQGNFEVLASKSHAVLRLGEREERARLYGLMYTGHVLARQKDDSVKWYYGEARQLAERLEDYRALAAIYNALAIYTSEMDMNYLSGLSYFMQALEYAEKSSDGQSYPVILNNLAMAYYLRNDSNGLKYSLEAVEIGQKNDDQFLIYSGSFVTAYMYYLLEDYVAALGYIEQALKTGGDWIEYAEAYTLYANILVRLGREQEAEGFYRLSLEHIGEESSNTLAYLNYGGYLISKGEPTAAIDILSNGMAFIDRRNNAFYRYWLYEKLSEAHAAAGDYEQALFYFRLYHSEFVNIFDVERERAISELHVQYETEKQKREFHEKEVALLRQRQKTNITLCITLFFVGVLSVLIVGQRRKNRRYRQIVQQQYDLIEKEKQLERFAASELVKSKPCSTETMGESVNDRERELFIRTERLMKNEHCYRDRNLTIESLAERLSTNRTYLSKAINQQSGKSFSQYINSYRIDAARHMLSDADNDIQIKELAYALGFSTPETFSASFRKAVGIVPSKFREEMRKMHQESRRKV